MGKKKPFLVELTEFRYRAASKSKSHAPSPNLRDSNAYPLPKESDMNKQNVKILPGRIVDLPLDEPDWRALQSAD